MGFRETKRRRLLLLTGAPPSSAIDEASCTVQGFDAAFRLLLGLDKADSDDDDNGGDEKEEAAVTWRALPFAQRPIPLVGAANISHDNEEEDTSFFSVAHLVEEDAWTQFCEQSLALYRRQTVGCDSLVSNEDETFCTDDQSASTLESLYPQTVSVDLIVGILSLSQARSVKTRWGKDLELVEVLVGDDTASSFAVTFWLPSPVVELRRQDVVLIQRVALRVFKGAVHGQSLARGVTKVTLLWRAGGGGCFSSSRLAATAAADDDEEKEYKGERGDDRRPYLQRTRVVRDWVLRFVGADVDAVRNKRLTTARSWDRPPDDTQ
ncbi:hypothetical protein CP533_4525 [Ophiocordyceps camponoti-saundersi (nom. inval.)]|nr:hypothetical protein CP533_4525 [Ophiocordyceps camponoti-saundersi (nom. inval.)]